MMMCRYCWLFLVSLWYSFGGAAQWHHQEPPTSLWRRGRIRHWIGCRVHQPVPALITSNPPSKLVVPAPSPATIQPKLSPPARSNVKRDHCLHPVAPTVTALRGGGAAVADIIDSTSTTMALAAVDYGPVIEAAYDWLNNLGSPSALVAGAVVATLYENIHSGDLVASEDDSPLVQLGKKLTHFLLLSAFALEVVAIFVTTVTGTMLLSSDPRLIHTSDNDLAPLEFLREHYEFEYLTARISFLQGLLNWLAAIALTHVLPAPYSEDNPRRASVEAFNKFVAVSILTVIVVMLSFYNNHMTFYKNYLEMIYRWVHVTVQAFFCVVQWPPRPLGLILSPLFVSSLYYGYQALTLSERPTPKAKHEIPHNTNNKTPGLFSSLKSK